jgi:predicted ribosomally synthesized peptide with nif11-like leader
VSRAYPSGGAAYSLELYPVCANDAVDTLSLGVYRYLPQEHALELVSAFSADSHPFCLPRDAAKNTHRKLEELMSIQSATDFIEKANQDSAIRSVARARFSDIVNVGRDHGFEFTHDEFRPAMHERKATNVRTAPWQRPVNAATPAPVNVAARSFVNAHRESRPGRQ